MIIVYHNGKNVVEIADSDVLSIDAIRGELIINVLIQLAKKHPNEILVWCHQRLREELNISNIESLFHHKKILVSYSPHADSFFSKSIGYVEASPFIKVNKSVTFPTWQMSSAVGGLYGEVLSKLIHAIPLDKNFDYFLCSLAKLSMPKGLLCYSEPKLLKKKSETISTEKASNYTLFRFVKQHYRTRWVYLLFLNLFLYERKLAVFPLLFSFFYGKRKFSTDLLDTIVLQSTKSLLNEGTIDVIIPTIGRGKYLYDVLKDLSKQTRLPKNVIIVEQNPDDNSVSELNYINDESWPFTLKHTFTHQAGACNARNIALKQITSEWVFFADDDIRIESSFIQKTVEKINDFGQTAVTVKCFQKGQKQTDSTVFQWGAFGSGCSFVFADSLKNCSFNMGYEFGFGEDGDFGMQLRNQGSDILYLPEPEILHLKAPIGGFRTKPVLRWQNDKIQPKPSPTVMLYQILHNTEVQRNGYKTTLFFKYYKLQKIKNPVKYYLNFQKQWVRSIIWANKLNKE